MLLDDGQVALQLPGSDLHPVLVPLIPFRLDKTLEHMFAQTLWITASRCSSSTASISEPGSMSMPVPAGAPR